MPKEVKLFWWKCRHKYLGLDFERYISDVSFDKAYKKMQAVAKANDWIILEYEGWQYPDDCDLADDVNVVGEGEDENA